MGVLESPLRPFDYCWRWPTYQFRRDRRDLDKEVLPLAINDDEVPALAAREGKARLSLLRILTLVAPAS